MNAWTPERSPPPANPWLAWPEGCRRLIEYLIENRLQVKRAQTASIGLGQDALTLHVHGPQGDVTVTVFDEYGDAASGNMPLLLILIANAFAELEDAGDARIWARSEGLDYNEHVEDAYAAGLKARAIFERAYGPIPDVLAPLEFQLNAGTAARLRALPARLCNPLVLPLAVEVWAQHNQYYDPLILKIFAGDYVKTPVDAFEPYSAACLRALEGGWEKVAERLHPFDPERQLETGEALEYWLKFADQSYQLQLLRVSPGEALAIRQIFPLESLIREFDSYYVANAFLRNADFAPISGRAWMLPT